MFFDGEAKPDVTIAARAEGRARGESQTILAHQVVAECRGIAEPFEAREEIERPGGDGRCDVCEPIE
jgi:hypothetical protein